MDRSIKTRHEFKYVCTLGQMAILRQRMSALMPMDAHAGQDGYEIRSIYFDDYQNTSYADNANGVDLRSKYRIRSYNGSKERISLECKRKIHGKTSKESCAINEEEYGFLMQGKTFEQINSPTLLQNFTARQQMYMLQPKVMVSYRRIPYVCIPGNVRITFDLDITTSDRFDLFFGQETLGHPIMPCDTALLEVKYDELLPDVIYRALELYSLRQSTFSKYYLCRKAAIEKRGLTYGII